MTAGQQGASWRTLGPAPLPSLLLAGLGLRSYGHWLPFAKRLNYFDIWGLTRATRATRAPFYQKELLDEKMWETALLGALGGAAGTLVASAVKVWT